MDTPTAIVASVTIGSTILGTMGGVVTLLLRKSSNGDMGNSYDKKELAESIAKLLSYYNELKMSIMEIRKDTEHLGEKLQTLADHADRGHREVKKLTMILYPLIKDEVAEQRRKMGLGSDTETGEI